MAVTMDAIILSVDEPQLQRCLQSVHSQRPPFTKIIHINNVSPESLAFTTGLESSTSEFVAKINGDFILYRHAVNTIISKLSSEDDKVGVYNFGLWDPFMRGFICGCPVYRREALDAVVYPDFLTNDKWVSRKMGRLGWGKKDLYRGHWKRRVVVGTHFEDPDEFQIFRRFYTQGVKYGERYGIHLLNLYAVSLDPIYEFAVQSLLFGSEKSHYPSSHNIHLDRELYKEFRENYYIQVAAQS